MVNNFKVPHNLDLFKAVDQLTSLSKAAEQLHPLKDAFLRVYGGSLGNLHSHNYQTSSMALKELMSQLDEYNNRFSLLTQNTRADLLKSFSQNDSIKALNFSSTRPAELKKTILSLKQPWIDTENHLQSIKAAVNLHTIGAGLLDCPPFDVNLSAFLRQGLGDWRSIVKLPSSIFTDPIERFNFYRERGFNDTLTDFPESAFKEMLDTSGLQPTVLPEPAERYTVGLTLQPDNVDEEAPELNLEAYALIFRLETNLRSFIDKQMTAHFGGDWPKHQLPGEMYPNWKDKRERAQAAGEPPQPLIAYADFSDYLPIIERKDNWNKVFRAIFTRKANIQESLTRLGPIRVCAMHVRVITSDDHLFLLAESRRIFKAIGINF